MHPTRKWITAVIPLLIVATAVAPPAEARKRGSLANYSKFCRDMRDKCVINCNIDYPLAENSASLQTCMSGCDDLIDVCEDARTAKISPPDKNLLNANPSRPGKQILTQPNLSTGKPAGGGLSQ